MENIVRSVCSDDDWMNKNFKKNMARNDTVLCISKVIMNYAAAATIFSFVRNNFTADLRADADAQ